MKICSFSYGWGQELQIIADGNWTVFDCRGLADPEGRGIGSNGKDEKVQGWIFDMSDGIQRMLVPIMMAVEDGEDLAFGCYAGKNRSVAMAEYALRYARSIASGPIEIEHRNLKLWT